MRGSWNEACAAVCLLAALAPLSGCGGTATPSRAGSEAPGVAPSGPDEEVQAASSPWEACYSSFAPQGDARGDLSRLVRDCGGMAGMQPVTAVRTGVQSDTDPVDRYTFEVTKAGTCYRVYAAADRTVEDLDLLLRGPDEANALADVTHDSWPVLPPREPACFDKPGLYQLEVSVYRGSGGYALQIWGR